MEDLNLGLKQMLYDFEEFERKFLQPFSSRRWLQKTDTDFIDTISVHDFPEIETSANTSSNFTLPNLVEIVPEMPLLLDDLSPFDPLVLGWINFDVTVCPQVEADTTCYIDKADVEYGEVLAVKPKVAENSRALQEETDRTSGWCFRGSKGEKVCCNGKCWASVECRWSQPQTFRRGRRKKGFEPSTELRKFCKERRRIKNRISAAECYRKEKAHIRDLEAQVINLRTENKIRRNMVKFLESGLQLRRRNQSLG